MTQTPSDSPQPAAPPPPAPPSRVVTDQDAYQWATFCHLGGLAHFIFPLGGLILPIVLWQIKKAEHAFIDEQGKEAVNFQLSFLIYSLVAIPLVFVIIGIFVLMALGILNIIFCIVAASNAGKGVAYRYPMAIRLIK